MIVFFKPGRVLALSCFLLLTRASHAQSPPPVILVGGGSKNCATVSYSSTASFGRLEAMLARKGIRTEFFEPCSVPSKSGGDHATMEEMGEALALRVQELANPVVDLVTYSVGGAIVDCYLSGKQTAPGVFKPPLEHKVRKVVFLGAGHFGVPWTDDQTLVYGSRYQWDLANWNQGRFDVRQVDAVSVVAFAGAGARNLSIPPSPDNDGVIPTVSGSLSFAYPIERTRVIPGCHTTAWCTPGVAYVSSETHPAWLVIDSFLDGTAGWKTVGQTPDQDPVLSRKGGLMVAVKDALDNLVQDAEVSISGRAMRQGMARDSVGTFVEDNLDAGDYTLQATAPSSVPNKTVTIRAGMFTVVTMKPGPLLAEIQGADGEAKPSGVTDGATITILGERLADASVAAEAPFPTTLGSTTVSLNGRPIPLLYVSETRITAQLPENAVWFARLSVATDKGTHGLNLFIKERPADPSVPQP